MKAFPPFSPIVAAILYATCLTARSEGRPDLHFAISTTQTWTDTGVDLHPGDMVQINAGSAREGTACNPAGDGAAAKNLPLTNAPAGALIARFDATGKPTLAGNSLEMRVNEPGHLWLGVNAQGTPPCNGRFDVTVRVTSAPAIDATPRTGFPSAPSSVDAKSPQASKPASSTAPATAAPATPAAKLASAAQIWLSGQFGKPGVQSETSTSANVVTPGINTSSTPGSIPSSAAPSTPALTPVVTVSPGSLDASLTRLIDGLPRRVNDEFDNLGDMVNFVIIGSEQQVQSALETAHWHVADKDVKEAALKAILQTYQKKDYLQMPMSQLRLFGRTQDYGYEQAEAYAVVASRHHFRIWKAPFTYNGQEVWVGAGTHDIGFEKDQRNGKVTHKIDPAVDGERDNVGMSLQKTGNVKSVHYYLPSHPVQEAKNATGGGYHSDGRILVIQLQ